MADTFNEKDPKNMAGYIHALPDDLENAWRQGLEFDLPRFPAINKIVISGMGGSAIGGDLFGSYLSELMPVPVASWRNYGLPAWANGDDCLVVCSSHSGNTEETLDAFQTALERGCSIAAISTGGKLQQLAREAGIAHWQFDHDGQPRTAVAWSFGLLLALVERLDLVANQDLPLEEAVSVMRAAYNRFEPRIALMQNPARRLAGQLINRNVVIFGAGALEVVARRWKAQIGENAKAWASFEGIPEMNHNTLAALLHPESLFEKTSAVFLRAAMDHSRNHKRIDLSIRFFLQAGVAVDEIWATGESRLAQMWSLLQFGDYVSYYLALDYGVDPTPVDILTVLKQELTG